MYYVGFFKRLIAIMIDTLILIPFFLITEQLGLGKFFALIVTWGYFAGLESSKMQGTVGKILVGIKVVDKAGKRINIQVATLRYIGRVLSTMIFLVGFIMVLFNSKKQGLHDLISGCFVVYNK